MPRLVEIIMRCLCFCTGLAMAFGFKISVKDEPLMMTLIHMLFGAIWVIIASALLILPWALPMQIQKQPP